MLSPQVSFYSFFLWFITFQNGAVFVTRIFFVQKCCASFLQESCPSPMSRSFGLKVCDGGWGTAVLSSFFWVIVIEQVLGAEWVCSLHLHLWLVTSWDCFHCNTQVFRRCLFVAKWNGQGTPTALQMWSCIILVTEKFHILHSTQELYQITSVHAITCSNLLLLLQLVTRHKVTAETQCKTEIMEPSVLNERAVDFRLCLSLLCSCQLRWYTVEREIS